jgi:hypothetical protein
MAGGASHFRSCCEHIRNPASGPRLSTFSDRDFGGMAGFSCSEWRAATALRPILLGQQVEAQPTRPARWIRFLEQVYRPQALRQPGLQAIVARSLRRKNRGRFFYRWRYFRRHFWRDFNSDSDCSAVIDAAKSGFCCDPSATSHSGYPQFHRPAPRR